MTTPENIFPEIKPLTHIGIFSYMTHDKTNLIQTLVDNILLANLHKDESKMNDACYAYFVNNPTSNYYDLEKIFRDKNVNTYFVAKENPFPWKCKLVDCRDKDNDTITHYTMIIVGRKDHYDYHINKYYNNDPEKNSNLLKTSGSLKAINPIYDISPLRHQKRKELASGDLKLDQKIFKQGEYKNLINYFYEEILMNYGCFASLIECGNTSLGKLYGLQANNQIIKMPFAFTHPDQEPIYIFSVNDLLMSGAMDSSN